MWDLDGLFGNGCGDASDRVRGMMVMCEGRVTLTSMERALVRTAAGLRVERTCRNAQEALPKIESVREGCDNILMRLEDLRFSTGFCLSEEEVRSRAVWLAAETLRLIVDCFDNSDWMVY